MFEKQCSTAYVFGESSVIFRTASLRNKSEQTLLLALHKNIRDTLQSITLSDKMFLNK